MMSREKSIVFMHYQNISCWCANFTKYDQKINRFFARANKNKNPPFFEREILPYLYSIHQANPLYRYDFSSVDVGKVAASSAAFSLLYSHFRVS